MIDTLNIKSYLKYCYWKWEAKLKFKFSLRLSNEVGVEKPYLKLKTRYVAQKMSSQNICNCLAYYKRV